MTDLGSSLRDLPQKIIRRWTRQKWYMRGGHMRFANFSLLDICRADVCDTVTVNKELKTYQTSIPPSPSYAKCKRKKHVREAQKAMKVGQEMWEESKNSHFIDPSSSCQPPNCRQRKGKRSTRRKSKEVLVNPQPATYEDIPNASSSNMPPCFASPSNVPPSFAPPSNVSQSFVSPSNMSPPNVGPPNMSLPSEPVFTVPSCHALTLMSVPTNSGSSSWQQAFHNTHCSTLSQVVLTSPRLLHPTTVITGLWRVSQPRWGH